MRRRGLSAAAISEKSRGAVSSSSVRSWQSGTALPTVSKLIAAVRALDDAEAAREVIAAFGYLDAAEGFSIETPAVAVPPALPGTTALGKVIATMHTSGTIVIVETDSGRSYLAFEIIATDPPPEVTPS